MKAVSWAGCDGCQQGAALETESLMLRFDTNVLAGTDTVKASFETAQTLQASPEERFEKLEDFIACVLAFT